jgi:hypothetical protein
MIRTIHVFQCGGADLYGITPDRTGANLPADECRDGWQFIKTIELEGGVHRGMDIAWGDRNAAVIAAIINVGYFIGEARALPVEINE